MAGSPVVPDGSNCILIHLPTSVSTGAPYWRATLAVAVGVPQMDALGQAAALRRKVTTLGH